MPEASKSSYRPSATQFLPTLEELKEDATPELKAIRSHGSYHSRDEYLNIHFSLLREDFIAPLRRMVRALCRSEDLSATDHSFSSTIVKIMRPVRIGSSYKTAHRLVINESKTEQLHHWRRLKKGGSLCLFTEDLNTMIMAMIAQDVDLSEGCNHSIDVNFLTEVDVLRYKDTSFIMTENRSYDIARMCTLAILKSEWVKGFAFQHFVLATGSDDVNRDGRLLNNYIPPIRRYDITHIMDNNWDKMKAYTVEVTENDVSAWPDADDTILNEMQLEAFKGALTERFSIIQGPPGTGKSFLGLQICRCLVKYCKTTGAKLVLVSTTNHALDEFVEKISRFHKSIVRIGLRSTSENLRKYQLNYLASQYQSPILSVIKEKQQKLIKKFTHYSITIKEVEQKIKFGVLLSLRRITHHNSETVITLMDGYQDLHDWLGIGDTSLEIDEKIMSMESHGCKSQQKKKEREQVLSACEKAEAISESQCNEAINTGLEGIDKWCLYKFWSSQVLYSLEKELLATNSEIMQIQEKYRANKYSSYLDVMKKRDIIAVTASGVAQWNERLRLLGPIELVIEEAADMLEANLISCMLPDVNHVVLIGDHQQLRPKVNEKWLASKYHLDLSLLQRFHDNGLEFHALTVQYRMPPTISYLLRGIYPSLQDHPSVLDREPVRGVNSSCQFLQLEVACEEREETETEETNKKEAAFLCGLYLHLLKQGYASKHITVMTPYRKQLTLLNDMLQSVVQQRGGGNVIITTVDGYQGEENDIILLSLVKTSSPGFIKESNRICVMLSRARKAFYAVGNIKMFASKPSFMWKDVIERAMKEEMVSEHLETQCSKHKTIGKVADALDFKTIAPDGGCLEPCGGVLPCDHQCKHSCHPVDPDHTTIEFCCKEICRVPMECGHKCLNQCHSTRKEHGPCQIKVEKTKPQCGHKFPVECRLDMKKKMCEMSFEEILTCGHPGTVKCGRKSSPGHCNVEISIQLAGCGHDATLKCKDRETYSCTVSCGKELHCGHKCQGTCGMCKKGRLHVRCGNQSHGTPMKEDTSCHGDIARIVNDYLQKKDNVEKFGQSGSEEEWFDKDCEDLTDYLEKEDITQEQLQQALVEIDRLQMAATLLVVSSSSRCNSLLNSDEVSFCKELKSLLGRGDVLSAAEIKHNLSLLDEMVVVAPLTEEDGTATGDASIHSSLLCIKKDKVYPMNVTAANSIQDTCPGCQQKIDEVNHKLTTRQDHQDTLRHLKLGTEG